MLDPILSIRGVSVTYRLRRNEEFRVLDEFHLDVLPGQVVAIMGDSGSGKTSLLNVVAGFLRPAAPRRFMPRLRFVNGGAQGAAEVRGSVSIRGTDVSLVEPHERDVGMVMQSFSLYPHMTVRENLAFPLAMRRVAKEDRSKLVRDVAEALDLVHWLDRYPDGLSGGESQRVALGKLILRDPSVALLDEAFSSIDPVLRGEFYDRLVRDLLLRPKNGIPRCALMVTHNLDEARDADVIVHFERGRALRDDRDAASVVCVYPEFASGGAAWDALFAAKAATMPLVGLMHGTVTPPKRQPAAKNAFGAICIGPEAALRLPNVEEALRPSVRAMFEELGCSPADAEHLQDVLWRMIRSRYIGYVEAAMRELVEARCAQFGARKALDRRAELIHSQILSYADEGPVLDVGCGDGMVSRLLTISGFDCLLTDVQYYVDPRVHLPFFRQDADGRIRVPGSPATALLLTVLHHSVDPEALLDDVKSLDVKRCIVIESVIGVVGTPGTPFERLDDEEQRAYASFIDWLYNRVIHDDVVVPFNYLPPGEWRTLFAGKGWHVAAELDLGFDQRIVPEYHYLFVLDRD